MNASLFEIDDGRLTFKRPVSFDELRKLVRSLSRVAYLSGVGEIYHLLDGCACSEACTPATVFDAHARQYSLCPECAKETRSQRTLPAKHADGETVGLRWLTSFLSSTSHAVR